MHPRVLGSVGLVLLAGALALGCANETEEASSGEAAATSAQDPAVAKIRRLFAESTAVSAPARLGTTSASGMTTRWANCIERSAKRSDVSTKTVEYAFVGSGDDVTNVGSGFGKTFLADATEESRLAETLGYPAGVATTPDVTLDVVRIAKNGDLVIERILKPAAHESDPSASASAAREYERSVYADPRASAVAYVQCPARDRVRTGGGSANVLYYDDCKDEAFTRTSWTTSDGMTSSNVCTQDARFSVASSLEPIHVEVEFGDAGAVVTLGGIVVEARPRRLAIGHAQLGPSQVLELPAGISSVTIEKKSGEVRAFAGAVELGPMVDVQSGVRTVHVQPTGPLSSVKIW